MSDPKCANLLISAAENDLDTLRILLEADSRSDEIFGYHAQQTAEKLLKAWIAALGRVYPLTHNLRTLIELIRDADPDPREFADLIPLNPFAVQFRYEAIGERVTALDRAALIARLEQLLAVVKGLAGGAGEAG